MNAFFNYYFLIKMDKTLQIPCVTWFTTPAVCQIITLSTLINIQLNLPSFTPFFSGLGTVSLGAIIFFVGTGEKGFKTQELRLIGPVLAGSVLNSVQFNLSAIKLFISFAAIGLVFCILRILFCVCPSHCISQRERNKKNAKVDADHRTSLLRDTKRVSIARGPYINVIWCTKNAVLS